MLILSVFVIALIEASPILRIPRYYLEEPVDLVRFYTFYPPGVAFILRRNKPTLTYGNPTHETLQFSQRIEAIPPEFRLNVLGQYMRTITRQLLSSIKGSDYHKFVKSLLFIDTRLLRLLIRIAVRKPNEHESELTSACAIIDHLRLHYPDEDFSYLTPEYILDWYEMLGGNTYWFYASWREWKQIVQIQEQQNSSSRVLLQVGLKDWRSLILEPRINRLRLTGYETIQ